MHLDLADRVLVLLRFPGFSEVSQDILGALADNAEEKFPKRQESIIQEGHRIDAVHFLVRGTAATECGGKHIEDLSAPDVIGLRELLDGVATAQVTVAASDSNVRVLSISRDDFMGVVLKEPELAASLPELLARREQRVRQEIEDAKAVAERLKNAVSMLEESLGKVEVIAESRTKAAGALIERKFLLKKVCLVELPPGASEKHLEQGYVTIGESEEIRVRYDGVRHTITAKKGKASLAAELDISIPQPLYELLLLHAGEHRISKTRYTVSHQGREWHVDVFDEDSRHAGLLIAEVDVREDEEKPEPPPGLVVAEDITTDARYKNRSLAQSGLPR